MTQETLQNRKALQWGEMDPHRNAATKAGMWAWISQRISALAIIVFITLHIVLPYKPFVQFMLLLTVTFHAVLGIRVILLDFNLVNVKYQKMLIGGLVGLGLVSMILIWCSIY